MGRIISSLNINKTPQSLQNYSLVFAKNIKLDKDLTIGRDDGLNKIELNYASIHGWLSEYLTYRNPSKSDTRRKAKDRGGTVILNENAIDSDIARLNVLFDDYTIIKTELESLSTISDNVTFTILGVIPYNTEFYVFCKCSAIETIEIVEDDETIVEEKEHLVYLVIKFDEYTEDIEVVDCNWSWGGGKITGEVIKNLKGHTLLNICENSDDVLVPFKSININKSSITDDESIYTQTPKIPLYNLFLTDWHTTPIPNGIYQFFIRYKIWDNHYTSWYPATVPLFSGDIRSQRTNQGEVSYIDDTYDASKAFVFTVDKQQVLSDVYDKFQIGFLLSHNEENVARSWKEFDINTEFIYFDYDKNYIEEIRVEDLLENAYQLYNIEHIASFKNKLYVSNYIETDFNPDLNDIARNVKVTINTKDIAVQTYSTWRGKEITLDENDNNIVTTISSVGVEDIYKYLVTSLQSKIFKLTDTNLHYIHDYNISLYYNTVRKQFKLETYNVNYFDNIVEFKIYDFERQGSSSANYSLLHKLKEEYSVENDYILFTQGLDNFTYDTRYIGLVGMNTYPCIGIHDISLLNGGMHRFTSLEGLVKYCYNNDLFERIDRTKDSDDPFLTYGRKWTGQGSSTTSTLTIYYISTIEKGSVRAHGRDYDQYSAKITEIKLSLLMSTGGFVIVPPSSQIDVIPDYRNLSTLIPLQTYRFYIHFISKTGEITNGFAINNNEDVTIGYYNRKQIYPSFTDIQCPDKYIGYFFSIQHVNSKVTQLFNFEQVNSNGSNYLTADCLDLDTRLIGNTLDLECLYSFTGDFDDVQSTIVNYYPSFDATHLELFGSTGKVKFDNSINTTHYGTMKAFIRVPYTNDNETTTLMKCTPYIKASNTEYNNSDNNNLLGFLNNVEKLDSNYNKWYSDTDLFIKRITYGSSSNTIALDDLDSSTEWRILKSSVHYLIYSNYNLNMMSIAETITKKIKMTEHRVKQGDSTTTEYRRGMMICFNSMTLSDVYELKSMYKDYTKKVFLQYSNKEIIKYDNTIRSSVLEGDESIVNLYKFNSLDYYNVPTNRNIITNLIAVGEALLVHTKDSMFKFTGTNTLTTGGGEDVALVENQPFDSGISELFGSRFGYAGLADAKESIVTVEGYMFYDRDCKTIYFYSDKQGLIPISDPIEKLLNTYPIKTIAFCSDYYNNRIIMSMLLSDPNNSYVTLSYNLITKSFISLHDYAFTDSFNTKVNPYFIHNNVIWFFDKYKSGQYGDLVIIDQMFPYKNIDEVIIGENNNENTITRKAAIVDVIFNDAYQQTKALESISWICKEIKIYADEWEGNPLMAEEDNVPYKGEYLRLYSDSTSTKLIDISNRSNDHSIKTTESYKYPRFNLGHYSFNYFRNVYKGTEQGLNISVYEEVTDELKKDGKYDNYEHGGSFDNVNPYDDQSLIYGKYFVSRFILDSKVDFKLENVIFVISPYQ